MPTTISGSTGLNLTGTGNQVTYADSSTQNTSPKTGFVNRIINGGMTIDQRNAGASVTVNSATDTYGVDRWLGAGVVTDGVFTMQQDASAPAGFSNSLKVTVTTADASVTGAQSYQVQQKIEGFNFADLGWGTASAQTVTLSFWVRSSLTGTFGGALVNSAFNRSYPFTYTISAANTWEQKSITVAGDTSGTWIGATNGTGLRVYFGLGAADRAGTAGVWAGSGFVTATGAVSVIGTVSATWYITGVQLEKGSTATPFEFRSIGQELALCQRYYLQWQANGSGGTDFPTIGVGYAVSTSNLNLVVNTPVSLRATPTVTFSGTISLASGGTTASVSVISALYQSSSTGFWMQASAASTFTTIGFGGIMYCQNATTNIFRASAEL